MDPDIVLDPARWMLLASVVGALVAALGARVHHDTVVADEIARLEAREALESVPRVVDPLVAAMTGEIEIVRVCLHLSTLDRMDGLKCSECGH